LFSTNANYLPIPPQGISSVIFNAGVEPLQIKHVILPATFSLFDGPEAVHKRFNLNTSASTLLNDKALKTKADDFLQVQGAINKMSEKALLEQEHRLQYEEENGLATTRLQFTKKDADALIYKHTKAKLHRELQSLSTKQTGFLMFLDRSKPNLPAIETILPLPFHPKKIIEKLQILQMQKKVQDREEQAVNNEDVVDEQGGNEKNNGEITNTEEQNNNTTNNNKKKEKKLHQKKRLLYKIFYLLELLI
jgi:hypothetical protein